MTRPAVPRPVDGREVVSERDFERLETRPDGTVSAATRGHESVVERPVVPARRTPGDREAITVFVLGAVAATAVWAFTALLWFALAALGVFR